MANSANEEHESYHKRLLSQLKCKGCRDFLFIPVRECSDCGHSLCPKCHETASRCPECGSKFDHFRSITLNVFLQDYELACLNEQCFNLKKHLKILEDHVKAPRTRRIKCPLEICEDCEFVGVNLSEAIWHCHQYHPANIYFTNSKVLRCNDFITTWVKMSDLCVIFVCYKEVFRIFNRVDYETRISKWQVFVTGGKKLAKKYRYEISFSKVASSKEKIVLSSPCVPYFNDEGINWDTDFIMVGYDSLKDLCFKRDLYCEVKILPTC